MQRAIVIGNVWSTKRLKEIPSGAMLEIELEDGKGTRVVAFDVLGCGGPVRVLASPGSVAAAWFPGKAWCPVSWRVRAGRWMSCSRRAGTE